MSDRRKPPLAAGALYILRCTAAALVLAIVAPGWSPAYALSEIQQEEAGPAGPDAEAPGVIPDDSDEDDGEDGKAPSDPARPDVDANKPLPQILYDVNSLPEAVRSMRERIIAACKSGDIEKLRPLLGTGEDATQFSLGELEGDPIKFLQELSGDDGGQEILAILLEVLEAGFVHLNAGDPSEIYVWPYFFAIPLDSLNPQQRVELFTLVTAGDYEDMKSFGAYIFYRVGITPKGDWLFFVAGD